MVPDPFSGTTVTANLLTGLGIDEFFTRTDSVGVRSLLPDALGSTVALGDGTGTLQTQYSYEPFGMTTQTGTASTSSYKYTGREDDGTGLMYYRARYYQPRLQRFIAEDPIGFKGGINVYRYVRNSPLRFRDPLGLEHPDCEGLRALIDMHNDTIHNPRLCPDPALVKERNRLVDLYEQLGCGGGDDKGGSHVPVPSGPGHAEQDQRLKKAARVAVTTAIAILITIITKVPVPIP